MFKLEREEGDWRVGLGAGQGRGRGRGRSGEGLNNEGCETHGRNGTGELVVDQVALFSDLVEQKMVLNKQEFF